MQLDPVGTYAQRGAELIAELAEASSFRLERQDQETISSDGADQRSPTVSIALKNARTEMGTLHLRTPDSVSPEEVTARIRWATRLLSKGLHYADRLADAGGRRAGEAVRQTLKRAPLTPRERDVVSLLVSGASTRDIATRTGLTVSTVNTYLKRIFSKLGVHSRVELIAKMAGTDSLTSLRQTRVPKPSQPTDY